MARCVRYAAAILAAAAIAGCGSEAEPASTTVATSLATTTTLPVTTTSEAATTTTTFLDTTTSSAPTTSSTAGESTTTTVPLLDGNWAAQPLIVAPFGALGWWDGAEWVLPEDAGGLPVEGGEDYQLAALDTRALTTGGEPVFLCEPILNQGVRLDDASALGEWPGPMGVAISAPWPLQPHIVEQFEDDGTYAAFAAEFLSSRGLEVGDPVVKQLVRTDLEGDGNNEVILVAEDVPDSLFAEPGAYSVMLLRKVVQGEVVTAVLGESVMTGADDDFLVSYSMGAVSDLSGDAKMEIVLSAAYYEGLGVEVWEYVDDDLGPVLQLQTGCGS